MQKLKLRIGPGENGQGEYKTFTQSFVKARMLRRAIEFQDEIEARHAEIAESGREPSPAEALKDVDDLVDFAVELFEGQFGPDDVWDGLETEQFSAELGRILSETVQAAMKGVQPDPNARKRRR
ncbi:phage tail assembly chaperone G [Alicyclobacillus sp. ALC3]|uniref:phage tail assembly chaperone G n=1 Tax=Alicyclobacillus sp. ALC3 TaxID=2796143 RepID=UPI002378E86C|nr:hypothetical protein [Alicyclobacillus sp. ALC3]WDL98124.1 hypothetical protein JC200_05330 [Alicyclobacillus sp. ALC3]